MSYSGAIARTLEARRTDIVGAEGTTQRSGAGRPRGDAGVLAMVLVAGVGVELVLIATRRTVNLDTDSSAYVGAAGNILHGRGISTPFSFLSQYGPARAAGFHGSVPLTHFPPMYPMVLAAVGFFHVPLITAARVVNALLMGINLFLVGVVLRRLTHRRAWPVAAGVMALLIAGPARAYFIVAPHTTGRLNWLWISSSVLSEPLFIFVGLSALLLLDERVRLGGSPARLGALVICCVLAVLTRYVGVSIAALSVLVLAFVGDRGRRQRWTDAAAVACAVGAALGAWIFYTSVLHHGAGARAIHYHHVRELKPSLLAIGEAWIMPASWAPQTRHAVLIAVGVAVAGSVGLLLFRRSQPDSGHASRTTLGAILCLFVVVYVGIVIASRELFDASIPINERILAPVQPVLYVLIVSLVWTVLQRRTHLGRRAIVACCLAVMLGPFVVGVAGSRGIPLRGFEPHRQDAFTHAIRALRPGEFIATNAPESLFLDTGRPSIIVPARGNAVTGEKNRNFDQQIRELGRVVAQRHGVVVLYLGNLGALAFPDMGQLQRLTSLRPIASFEDGVIAAASAHAPTGG